MTATVDARERLAQVKTDLATVRAKQDELRQQQRAMDAQTAARAPGSGSAEFRRSYKAVDDKLQQLGVRESKLRLQVRQWERAVYE